MKRISKARNNTTENKLSLGRVSLDRMEPAADIGRDKSYLSEGGKRKEWQWSEGGGGEGGKVNI